MQPFVNATQDALGIYLAVLAIKDPLVHWNGMSCTNDPVRATSDNMNKQKARENLRYICVMNEYVHT